jgi:hypothetical protein
MGAYSGSYRQRPGMMSSPNRPQAIQPIPEEYAGINFPYRGPQNHGVEHPDNVDPEAYYDNDQYDDGPDKVPTLPPEKEPDPINVRVVNESARERYAIRTYTFPANGQTAQQMCGRNDRREKVLIKNHTGATNDLLIGPGSGLDPITGYVLEPGQEVELHTTEEIYVIAAGGDANTLVTASVLEEVSVEL